ncbi:MAG: dihydrolipoyl dehydrogenase [Bacteroidales bacterium]|jgi:dihydrolipoamide dehydrogenase
MFDLAIIGSGPGGYIAAERAGAQKLKTVLFEKKKLGGVCLNEGCIPTKTILYSAKLYDNALHSDKYGISTKETSVNIGKIIDRKNRTVRRLAAGIASKLKSNNVNVVSGTAMIIGRSANGISIECDGTTYNTSNLLICSGSEAFVPPIPGVAEAGDIILTNREILELKEVPESLTIIGGGVIGMEFASFYNSLGSHVTVIEMLPEILGGIDKDISSMIRDIYAKRGVKFNLSCEVTSINKNEVTFVDAKGLSSTVSTDKILISVGRRPVISGFGVENLGVEIVNGAIKVDNKMRTNIPNVFAAGDVTGFSMFAHTASREGEVVVNNLLGKNDFMSYNAIPGVVYTNPEVASAGLTEEEAKTKGINYRVSTLPMAFSGRFVAENEGGNGICKIVVGAGQGEILGMHMLGNPCSELIYGACMAIEQKMTTKELEKVIFPHPTVSEIIKETIFSF